MAALVASCKAGAGTPNGAVALRELRVALGCDDEEVIQHAIEEGIIDFLLAALQVRKYLRLQLLCFVC